MEMMTIGQLAAEAGLDVETIRFYERRQLIEQPRRPQSGFRKYDESAIQRLAFIKQAQDLGFSLSEIRELLALRVDPRTSCADVRARAESKISDVEKKIDALNRMRAALVAITKSCSGVGPTSDCPILDGLSNPTKRVKKE